MREATSSERPISVGRVGNPTKKELAFAIADALDITRPPVSRGSSVDSTFLDRIHEAVTGDKSVRPDAYRKTEQALEDLGLTYDPFWDTSESSATGGSTVTNRAYSRILAAVSGTPRCFLVNIAAGSWDERGSGATFAYGELTTGRGNLNDAGPGSKVLFYRFSSGGNVLPVSRGEVSYIASGWAGPWVMTLDQVSPIAGDPVLKSLGLAARSSHIAEISHVAYRQVLADLHVNDVDGASRYGLDPGGEVAALRVLDEFPVPDLVEVLQVPDVLSGESVELQPPVDPRYQETAESGILNSLDLPRSPRDRGKAKIAEERAVAIAQKALEAEGWRLVKDRQKDGVGYDLLYQKDGRELHVEVKGIQGGGLSFNLTPKEAWRVETDPLFCLIAVTNVLSPTAFKVRLLLRDEFAEARRIITGYRLRF